MYLSIFFLRFQQIFQKQQIFLPCVLNTFLHSCLKTWFHWPTVKSTTFIYPYFVRFVFWPFEIYYLKARNFRGMKLLRHLISRIFIFYNFLISWHFNFADWPKYYNPYSNFAIPLKNDFFKRMDFRNFGKSIEPTCKLKYIFIYFYTSIFTKVSKNKKTSYWFKIDLPPACQEALSYKFVMTIIR